ncbi:MAG TPA: NAD(P)H-binding protein [Anaerolineales bacterium]|nr:NAD(P)H-binding protein [Anaerolineales bacterium]
MKLAIIGSTGFVGTLLLKKALSQEHQLKALVRSPEKLGNDKDKVEIVRGDMFDPSALEMLVQGVDAVISVAGPPLNGRFDVGKHALATQDLVNAIKNAKIKRLITIAGAAAEVPGQKLGFKQSLLRFVLGTFVRPDVIKVKDMELKTIAESGLNWTVLRPPLIGSGKPTGYVAASNSDLTGMKIDVEDITDFILLLLKTNEWDCKAPIISSQKKN